MSRSFTVLPQRSGGASTPTMADSFMIMGATYQGSSTSNKSFYSHDGITWTSHVYPSAVQGQVLPIWNGQYWLFVANGVVGMSSDGIKFTLRTVSGINYPRTKSGISWNGRMWVVVPDQQGAPWYSYDGITWTQVSPFPANNGLNCVGWGKDKFIIGGNCGGNPNMFYSYDGIKWVSLGSPLGNGGNWTFLIQYTGTLWLGTGRYMSFMTSPDGFTWTNGVSVAGDTLAPYQMEINGQYIVTGQNTSPASSNGGLTWSLSNTTPGGAAWCIPSWNGNAWYIGVWNGSNAVNVHSASDINSTWTKTGSISFVSDMQNQVNISISARRLHIPNASTSPALYQGALSSPPIISNVVQPFVQYGTATGSGGTGTVAVTIPAAYTTSNSYVVQVTMRDAPTAQLYATPTASNAFTIGWSSAGSGTQTIMWTSFGT